MASFYFGVRGPTRPHLTRNRGVAGEVRDLRDDICEAFSHLEEDIQALSGGQIGGDPIFTQDFGAAPQWIVNHNLGRQVLVKVLNAGGAEIDTEVIQPNLNQVLINFVVQTAGKVVIR